MTFMPFYVSTGARLIYLPGSSGKPVLNGALISCAPSFLLAIGGGIACVVEI